ncbi:serine/threonine protein kinase [Kineosporia rhizophila]|uniref:serine/threonine-protein kinase n=1 Tax=Kineosporia TaxID=49184 RepID=UPI001E54D297|nr:serine/threonine-protein kinase [Kineosporia sp. NBRC 101677]MCE0540517.1 serine/threonine protein kinase [Kineosporia rhizophila]GLY19011.1 hypothetical protein Kisp01_60250 [Kineosporia sp. NBRC 101677]
MYDLRPGDPEQIGEFRVVGRLGGGGMGTVYLGEAPEGRLVAIKVVHEYLATDPEFRRRFGHEVEAASRISGTYTAEVLTADPDARLPWMATEYVEGRNLLQTIEASGPLHPDDVLDLAAGVADALTEIHRAGVIHRDLKPSNILMSPQGPRVIDFGIARAAEASTVTSTGKITGSAAYMSPEQAVGKRVGPATDIFSLGALLYYAATGEPAFGTGPATAMLYRTVHASVDMTPIHSAELRDLIDACLEKDPEDRPNAKHVAIAARTGQPVTRLPRSTPPTGMQTPAEIALTAQLGANSAYDALMDQVASATAGRGNPVIAPPEQRRGEPHRGEQPWWRTPIFAQAAGGAVLLVAVVVGGVIMLNQDGGQKEDPAANVSGSQEEGGLAPTASASSTVIKDKDGKLRTVPATAPNNIPTAGATTRPDGTVVIPSGSTTRTATAGPSRTTGPKPSDSDTPDDDVPDDDDDPTVTSKPTVTPTTTAAPDPTVTTDAPPPTTTPADPTTTTPDTGGEPTGDTGGGAAGNP